MTRAHHRCRRCDFVIPADAPLCPGCRRPAVEDWAVRARRIAAVEREARRLAPPLHDAGYRSLLLTATLARAALALTAAVAVVVAVLSATATLPEQQAATVGDVVLDADELARAATAALGTMVIATGAAFVAWAVRAYRNLPALGITDRRYWTIWLVIGWVVPAANLLVPKLLVDDLWRASSPSVAVDGRDWRRRPVDSLVNRWWCSFLLTPSLAVLAAVAVGGGIGSTDARYVAGAACVAAAVSVVVAGVSARRLVAVVTVAQARRADLIVDVRRHEQAAVGHRLALRQAGMSAT